MSTCVSPNQWAEIKNNYTYYENDGKYDMPRECRKHDDWQRVYQQGCDSKYGTIMVSHEMRAWRHPTFFEFYGGSVID